MKVVYTKIHLKRGNRMEYLDLLFEDIWKICMMMNLFFLIKWSFFGNAKKARLGWIHLFVWPIIIGIGPLGTMIIFVEFWENRLNRKVTNEDI